MQILHPFAGSVAEYLAQLDNPDQHRPDQCPQCQAKQPLTAHGFYTRTIIDSAFDGWIRVRRYLCKACRRTVSLLPEFALPYLRSSVTVIALFLMARLFHGRTLKGALPPASPYERGQWWVRRFRAHAEALCAALSALTEPAPALHFVARALTMLDAAGWIPAHRFLFAASANTCWAGRARSLLAAAGSPSRPAPRPLEPPHTICLESNCVSPYARTQGKSSHSMPDDKAENIALFRYGLIALLVLETLPRGELTRRAQQIASRLYDIPHSTRRQCSVDTLLEWTLRYRRNGLAALMPKPREDRGRMRAIPQATAALIERLKRESPHRTGTALPSAHKKYGAECANQIWQSDMLFGPWVQRAGGGKMQVFLQATLDDASRLIPHAQFYPNQGLDSFLLDCLRQSVTARGVPTRLYMDNAHIYRSPQLARIAASIGILIIHTPPYQPEGRGKIERFFRSVREQFLANLEPKVLLSLDQLNEQLWHWLDTVYHRREHSALQTTPLLRWQQDIARVRQLPPATDMRRLFFHRVDRLVRRDSTFLLRHRFFEAPPHLAGQKIEVRFDPLDLTQLEIYCAGKLEGVARLVDAVVNGRTYR